MNPLNINPTIVKLGPFEIRWYGLMYVIGTLIAGQIFVYLSKKKYFQLSKDKIESFVFWLVMAIFIGARSFYVFIYNWEDYSKDLWEIFKVWHGGLSFHGAIVGFVVVCLVFSKKYKIHIFNLTDSLALAGTQGLFFGRIGNFINGEVYGRITDSPVGLVFSTGGPYPRHASQLYEAFCEGILLSVVLWIVKKKTSKQGMVSCAFFIGYGVFRYIIEFFREPDPQLGLYFGNTTSMGQILCLIMVFLGFVGLIYCYKLNISLPAEYCSSGSKEV